MNLLCTQMLHTVDPSSWLTNSSTTLSFSFPALSSVPPGCSEPPKSPPSAWTAQRPHCRPPCTIQRHTQSAKRQSRSTPDMVSYAPPDPPPRPVPGTWTGCGPRRHPAVARLRPLLLPAPGVCRTILQMRGQGWGVWHQRGRSQSWRPCHSCRCSFRMSWRPAVAMQLAGRAA